MAYETSYDAGLKPFNHDKNRGKWASPMDFFFACIGHAFKVDAVFMLPAIVLQYIGFYSLIPYFVIMLVCTIPIVFMQSFLGQFSSTGFISVFRVAPLFKGIGYVSLAINVATLTYYSLFAAMPLFFFLHSLRPTLPWSCEGSADWLEDHGEKFCNITNVDQSNKTIDIQASSLEFFMKHLNITERSDLPDFTLSCTLIICTFVIWVIIWVVLRKSTETIGRIIRYSTVIVLTILGVCVVRFGFLPGAYRGIAHFFQHAGYGGFHAVLFIPLMCLYGLGPGWGSILTMASYNNFKNDITKHTWILCLGQFGLMMLGTLSWIFVENFLTSSGRRNYILHRSSPDWMQFMLIPSALTVLEVPRLWSLLYFGMLTVGSTIVLIVQLFSVLTSLFDEFEQLREMRKDVISKSIGVLALCSTLFCSNYGLRLFVLMTQLSIFTQILLNLLLLLVVLWIYGRERLQRDLKFMTNRTYSTWMVYIVRFIAPLVLLYSFFAGLVGVVIFNEATLVFIILAMLIVLLPWLLIPGYCIFKIIHTTGILGRRFRRSVRPTDWYPRDPIDRQRYEDAFGKTEISHQLTTTIENGA